MSKKLAALFFSVALLFMFKATAPASDALNRRDYALGWQFSKPASGFSLKIPIDETYFLQPVFSFSWEEKGGQSRGNYAAGLRALYELPDRSGFQPYFGLAVGHRWSGENTNGAAAGYCSATGLEALFGVEYRKYLLRPALEIGMGGYQKSEGDNYAGLTVNFSLAYYF